MRVLITGASGFVGGALAQRLLRRKDVVTALVRDGDAPDGCNVIRGELEDLRSCERAVVESSPDVIFHLAAQAIVGHARVDPWSTFESNVRGTYNLLEAYRRHAPAALVVVASSDKAYGELTDRSGQYREDDPMAGRGPYDCSKSCTDLIAQSYGHSYGLNLAIVRAGNIYGPGDSDLSRIVPSAVDDIVNGRNVVIRSDGTPVRDYLYIDDAVDAYLAVAEYLRTGGDYTTFNFSGGQPVTVLEVVNTLRTAATMQLIPQKGVKVLGSRTGEIRAQNLNTTRARTVLGWTPKVSLFDGLWRTLDRANRMA